MTVTVAETGAATAEAGAAEASSGARQATRRAAKDRTIGSTPETRRRMRNAQRPSDPSEFGGSNEFRGRTAARGSRQGRQGPAGPAGSPGQSGRQGGSQRRGSGLPRGSGKGPDLTNYQAVILGEFVAAVLLVAATPFAKKDSPGVSPYAGSDLLQLVAITLVYFLLALISGANRGAGRFSAWFGALILLTVGLGEAARLAKLLNVFGLQSPSDQFTDASQGLGNQSGGPA